MNFIRRDGRDLRAPALAFAGAFALAACGGGKQTVASGTGGSASSASSSNSASSGTASGSGGSSGVGGGAPSAVTNLQLVRQGGANNATSPVTNSQQISWDAATPGGSPIDHYQIYRNGVAYATTAGTQYSDDDAPGSNFPDFTAPAKIYSYDVDAVDAKGNHGPKAGLMSVYAYRSGQSNWSNYDLSWGTIMESYSDTNGNPMGGPFDVSVNFIMGGFQPTVHPPQAPIDDLEVGAFDYFVVDVNPGPMTGFELKFGTVSRLPPGDVFGWHPNPDMFTYGPAPKANTWATYKIPLVDAGMGTCTFAGSITGKTLTVTSIVSGQPLVDAGGFVTGPGVPDGTYITEYGQNSAIGTFTVAGPGISNSTAVPSATLTFQRTSLYKFALFPSVSAQMYFNNMGFTTN